MIYSNEEKIVIVENGKQHVNSRLTKVRRRLHCLFAGGRTKLQQSG